MLTNFENLMFSFAFKLASYNSVSNRYFLNHFACLAVWCYQHANINISETKYCISVQSKSNVIIITQSRCSTLQPQNNLIHHEIVYNLSILFSLESDSSLN